MYTHRVPGRKSKELQPWPVSRPLPPPYWSQTNAALSTALSSCRQACSSRAFYLVPACTDSETRALFLVPFKCVRHFAWEDKCLPFHVAFQIITLSPSAGGGLPKKVETSDLLCPLQLRGRENWGGGGGGGGRLSAVENNEGGRVLRWGGCCAARGEARTARPPTPLWCIAARFAPSQHPRARASQRSED